MVKQNLSDTKQENNMKIIKIIFIFYSCLFYFILDNGTTLKQYYCTAADSRFFPHLKNLIGSIHQTNFDVLGEIAVFDLGLINDQINNLQKMQKVTVNKVEITTKNLLTNFVTSKGKREVRDILHGNQ